MGIFDKLFGKKEKLDNGLEQTRQNVFNKISRAIIGKSKVDEEVLDHLEEALITSDVGVETTLRIIERLEARIARDKYMNTNELNSILCEEISSLLAENETSQINDFTAELPSKPYVIMVVGVNGVGKTTSIGKIAARYVEQGKRVMLAAADTFRAAAADQLEVWAKRAGAEIVRHGEGADPAAVVFDAIAAAKARGCEIIIIDTAGRLHNKANLMNELAKIDRILTRELPNSSRETLLVLDATTGQNAVHQAEEFNKAAELTGIILTKLDGTAKGGIVVAISAGLGVPVKLVGVGEGLDDLMDFNRDDFLEALLPPAKSDNE